MTAERDILDALANGRLTLPPLALRVIEIDRAFDRGNRQRLIDAVIEASWGSRSWRFAAELKRLSTPKILQDALATIRPIAEQLGLNPMIVVPYLSRANVEMLEDLKASGIDLCGNGFVTVPGELLISRTGNPNRFPQSATIRNVYRGDSSMVARTFLARPEFRSVGDIKMAVRDLGGDVTLSTVSKVLKVLEGDLIVSRETGSIRLLQPDKLLEALSSNYRQPKIEDRYIGKVSLEQPELQQALAQTAKRLRSKFVLTGAASATQYAVMGREPVVAAYCDIAPADLMAALPARSEQTDRFPNIDLMRTPDAPVYFDAVIEAAVPFASPVQTYLELSAGDKRQRETAEQVRESLLRRIKNARNEA